MVIRGSQEIDGLGPQVDGKGGGLLSFSQHLQPKIRLGGCSTKTLLELLLA